jgi:small subunit ribosomal protein S6
MAQTAPTYDLVLLLDPRAQESARAKILADARQTIAANGEIVRDDDWGDRALSYPIQHKADAEYHLLQFKTGAPELLSEMSRTLHITDGILRFRIIKLKPGTPDAPDMRSGAHSARPTDTGTPAAGSASSPAPAPASAAETVPAETAQAEPAPAETAPAQPAPAEATGRGEAQAAVDAPGPARDAGEMSEQERATGDVAPGEQQSS